MNFPCLEFENFEKMKFWEQKKFQFFFCLPVMLDDAWKLKQLNDVFQLAWISKWNCQLLCMSNLIMKKNFAINQSIEIDENDKLSIWGKKIMVTRQNESPDIIPQYRVIYFFWWIKQKYPKENTANKSIFVFVFFFES